MTDFSKMDGQEVCKFLKNFDTGDNPGVFALWENTEELFVTINGKLFWNLPACAFAARDWCKKEDVLDTWFDIIQDRVGDAGIADPIDWLRAAAIVIAEKGSEE